MIPSCGTWTYFNNLSPLFNKRKDGSSCRYLFFHSSTNAVPFCLQRSDGVVWDRRDTALGRGGGRVGEGQQGHSVRWGWW